MPDYPEFKFGIYGLRLRPSDSLRLNIARLGLPDLLNFFNASVINLHFRVSIPNKKEYRNISDSIYYEWILCNDEDKQVEKPKDPRFCFYNTEGNGVFEFSSAKPPKMKRQDEQEPKYYWLKNSYFVSVFQPKAIKIGNLSKLSHYKVIMRFIDSSGVKSEYVPMAEFTFRATDNPPIQHLTFDDMTIELEGEFLKLKNVVGWLQLSLGIIEVEVPDHHRFSIVREEYERARGNK